MTIFIASSITSHAAGATSTTPIPPLASVLHDVTHYARRLTRDRDQADDIAQMALLYAWEKRAEIQGDFTSWCRTAVRWFFWNECRRRKWLSRIAETYDVPIEPSQEWRAMVAEALRKLDTLPEGYAEILLMHAQGYEHTEIGKAFGTSEYTARRDVVWAQRQLSEVA